MRKALLRPLFVSAFVIIAVAGTLGAVDFGVADTAVSDDWPTLQHDGTHSGFSTSHAPITNATSWISPIYSNYSSPVAANGKVFIGSPKGIIYCFNPQWGSLNWTFNTNQTNSMQQSTPTVAKDRLYIGVGIAVYCLNASCGSLIWKYNTGAGAIQGCPAVADGRVYIGSPDYNMYCLDAVTGERLWNFTTDLCVFTSPVVMCGIVYFGSYDSNVYALNASTGAKIWSYKTGLFVNSPPTLSNGKVCIGSLDGFFYCLNASSGAYIWSRQTGAAISGGSASVNGKIYVGSQDSNIYCLDAESGKLLWTFATGSMIIGSPAVADGKVYIGSFDNKIYCLAAESGSLIWNYDTKNSVGASPAIANGIVYLCSSKMLYKFAGPSSLPAPTLSPSPTPSATPTNKPTPTPAIANQPTPSPKPKSVTPIFFQQTTIQVSTNWGLIFSFTTYGNITASHISSARITTNQAPKTAQLSLKLIGECGTVGFSNITVPKSVVNTKGPVIVLIDGEAAESQGYTQDTDNYYVWYTTPLSSIEVSIVFKAPPSYDTVILGAAQDRIVAREIIQWVLVAAVGIGLSLAATRAVHALRVTENKSKER